LPVRATQLKCIDMLQFSSVHLLGTRLNICRV